MLMGGLSFSKAVWKRSSESRRDAGGAWLKVLFQDVADLGDSALKALCRRGQIVHFGGPDALVAEQTADRQQIDTRTGHRFGRDGFAKAVETAVLDASRRQKLAECFAGRAHGPVDAAGREQEPIAAVRKEFEDDLPRGGRDRHGLVFASLRVTEVQYSDREVHIRDAQFERLADAKTGGQQELNEQSQMQRGVRELLAEAGQFILIERTRARRGLAKLAPPIHRVGSKEVSAHGLSQHSADKHHEPVYACVTELTRGAQLVVDLPDVP